LPTNRITATKERVCQTKIIIGFFKCKVFENVTVKLHLLIFHILSVLNIFSFSIIHYTTVVYCDVWPESRNLCICWAEFRGAHSHGNAKYTVTLGFDGAIGDISVVATF
jgi:hypothetical protein